VICAFILDIFYWGTAFMSNKFNHFKEQPNQPRHVAVSRTDSMNPEDAPGWKEFINALSATTEVNTHTRVHLDALPDRFPRLFPTGHLTWGFEIGVGWAQLIALLVQRIDTLLKQEPNAKMQVRQVKEKFGALRFYYAIEDASPSLQKAVGQVVAQAELASSMYCERCGQRGELGHRDGWMTTVCSRCATSL